MTASQPGDGVGLDAGRLLEALAQAGAEVGLGFAVTDVSCELPRVVYVSEGAASISGRSVADMLAGSIFESIAPEELPKVRALLARRRESTESMLVETMLVTPAGARVPIEIGTTGINIEGRRFAATIIRDVSRRALTELALRESEQRFRLLVEHGPDGVVILRGQTVLYMSPRAASLLDLASPEAALGRSIGEFLDPAEARRAAERLAEIRATGGRLEPAEYSFHSANGDTRFVEIASVPVLYEGQPAVVAFARDVTDRKLLSAQLVKADRLSALGLLSAAIAHEINNPLAYIQLGLEVLHAELAGGEAAGLSRAELAQHVEELQQGVARAAAIVKDLRVFSRAEELKLGRVDMEAVLERALRLAENEIRHRARLVRNYADIPAVFGNAASLEQVFLNLLVNAAQAIAPGAVAENLITLSVRTEADGQIRVDVGDTGSGIAERHIQRLFEPLFTTKPAGVGTGLGLGICRKLLTAQGGEISIASREHRGTTVSVLLQAFRGEHASKPKQDASPGPDARQLRVWVVDDEPMIGKLMAQLLGDEHNVRAATEVAEVIAWLEEGAHFDVILCDLMMPGQGGRELHGVLKERWPGQEKRMLLMTGGAFSQEQAEFLDSVEVPVLTKPFDLGELRSLLLATADGARSIAWS